MLDLAPPVIIQDATVDQAVLNELFREGDIVLVATTVRFDPQIVDHDGAVAMDAAKPVSYTHLDVYKRQVRVIQGQKDAF